MIIEYILAVVSALIIDGVWLGVISTSLYQKYIGSLMLAKPQIVPAIIFYIIFGLGIVAFVTHPALKNNWAFGTILWHGALLGLLIYGGYELTNLALLKGWSVVITYIDITWGVFLTSVVSLITVYLSKIFLK